MNTTATISAIHDAVWQSSLIDAVTTNGARNAHGQVTIDGDNQSGNGTFQFSGQAKNAAYDVQYCYAPVSSATCHVMMTATTDANGAATGSFVIPSSQPWLDGRPWETVTIAIAFDGTQTLITAWTSTDSTAVYSVPLFKTIGQSDQPPTSGRVTSSGSQLHINIRSATPNTRYNAAFIQQLGTASGGFLGTVTTDANGNADTDLVMSAPGFGITLTPDVGANLVDGVRTR
jgi:hypothetical protein